MLFIDSISISRPWDGARSTHPLISVQNNLRDSKHPEINTLICPDLGFPDPNPTMAIISLHTNQTLEWGLPNKTVFKKVLISYTALIYVSVL